MRRVHFSQLAAALALVSASAFASPAYAQPTFGIEDYDPACVAAAIPNPSAVQGWPEEQIRALLDQRCPRAAIGVFQGTEAGITIVSDDSVNTSSDSASVTVESAPSVDTGGGGDNGGTIAQDGCGGSCGIGNEGNGTANEAGGPGNAGGNQDQVNGNQDNGNN